MPIVSSDISFRLSGGATNANPLLSLGGVKSSNVYPAALYDDVSAAESLAGDSEFRCFYVHNNHASLVLTNAVIWIGAQSLGPGHAIALGVGSSAINGIEQTVANETAAPTGVVFSGPTTQGAALSLGSIPAGQHKAVWQRRIVTAGSSASANSFTPRVYGETAA